MICPLCGPRRAEDAAEVRGIGGRRLLLCSRCLLVSAPLADRPDRRAERERYLLHRNSLNDKGYVSFLQRLWDPVKRLLSPGMRGLDYGCGPEPVLRGIVERDGFACDAYDPFFLPSEARPRAPKSVEGGYDFLLCSEVFEHFHEPGLEIPGLLARLRPGGLLGVMTELWSDLGSFPRWSYTGDFTHVSFYHLRSFDWIAAQHALSSLHHDGRRVLIFRRGPTGIA